VGLARPSLEWDRDGNNITREDILRMREWGANTVRLAVLDDYWLDEKGELYQQVVGRVIRWITQADMDVILDLHHISGVDLSEPNADCTQFWQEAAGAYQNNQRVIFELFNEPNGGNYLSGLQGLYTTARNASSEDHLIIVSGTDWTYQLGDWVGNEPAGPVAYATHPYDFKANWPASKTDAYLTFSATHHVVATEFGSAAGNGIPGDTSPTNCHESVYGELIDEFEDNNISWTAWAWNVDESRCSFPTLIDSYDGEDTTEPGAIVKQKFQQYAK
jgi:hypothetical protein